MKFSFDVDGVITEASAFFAVVTAALRAAGHTVYVVSDLAEHFRAQREQELADYGIVCDEFIITAGKYDFCVSRGIDYALDDDPTEYFPECAGPTLAIKAILGGG